MNRLLAHHPRISRRARSERVACTRSFTLLVKYVLVYDLYESYIRTRTRAQECTVVALRRRRPERDARVHRHTGSMAAGGEQTMGHCAGDRDNYECCACRRSARSTRRSSSTSPRTARASTRSKRLPTSSRTANLLYYLLPVYSCTSTSALGRCTRTRTRPRPFEPVAVSSSGSRARARALERPMSPPHSPQPYPSHVHATRRCSRAAASSPSAGGGWHAAHNTNV